MMNFYKRVALATLLVLQVFALKAEDGHRLWLRMTGNENAIKIHNDTKGQNPLDVADETKTLRIALSELQFYIREKISVHVEVDANAPKNDGFG